MNGWLRFAGLFFALLFVAGCASWEEMGKNTYIDDAPFDINDDGDEENDEIESVAAEDFDELLSAEPIGLDDKWSEWVAHLPDDHMQHPRRIVVSGQDLFLGTFQGEVVRLERKDGDTVWEAETEDSIVGGVAVDADRVYAGTRSGKMFAFSREDGHKLWQVSVSTSVASAPEVAGDKVIFSTLDNRTYALNSEDGKRLWMHSTTPESLVIMGAATPAVDGNVVYVGYASGEVFALSLEKGTPLWMENLSVLGGRSELERLQDVDAGIVVPNESDASVLGLKKIFTVNHHGYAVAMYPRTGTRIWEHSLSAIRRPLLMYKRLFISDMDGDLVALSAEDGLGLWRTHLSEGLLTAPVALGEHIFVADNFGQLFLLDAASGRVLGLDQIDDTVLADPVVVGNSIFLWTNEGYLLRYDL